MTATHIYPIDDLKLHETEGNPCWCTPRVEENGQLIIHNSLDGREAYETGKRKPH